MTKFKNHITNPEIDKYIYSLAPTVDDVQIEMEELASERGFPIVGPLVGRVLYQLTKMKEAKTIFELGSGFGYSAYWFAKAVDETGHVHLTERSQKNADKAKEFLTRADLIDKTTIHIGDGLDILNSTEGPFDIIFNDINKEQYPDVVESAYDKLNTGGLLITDNVLWQGRVVSDDDSPSTTGVKKFNELIFNHSGFFSSIIPIRDGISISVKLR